jgi:hypothetical protein
MWDGNRIAPRMINLSSPGSITGTSRDAARSLGQGVLGQRGDDELPGIAVRV